MTRFIFITGGVVSSLGKGLSSAALGALLQARGFTVRLRKLDPYLNVDPGTMSPYQHGEVFVTDDGAETDLDLGHYERYTGVPARRSDSVTTGRIYSTVIGRERRVLVDRIQATMAVIEGHAEHVMDAVGAEVIPSQAELRVALERRRMARSGPMRLLERVLGFELKLRQYRDGKRFCDAVVERIGIEGFNRVWSAPHALPTLAELVDPDAWIARTAVPFVTK